MRGLLLMQEKFCPHCERTPPANGLFRGGDTTHTFSSEPQYVSGVDFRASQWRAGQLGNGPHATSLLVMDERLLVFTCPWVASGFSAAEKHFYRPWVASCWPAREILPSPSAAFSERQEIEQMSITVAGKGNARASAAGQLIVETGAGVKGGDGGYGGPVARGPWPGTIWA